MSSTNHAIERLNRTIKGNTMNASLFGILLWHLNGSTVFHSCRWDNYETADRLLWDMTVGADRQQYTGGDILRWDEGNLEPVITRKRTPKRRFAIESTGNGATFTIVRLSDGETRFLQDGDAVAFDEALSRTNDRFTNDDLAELYFD